ncbi:MAG TPA: PAS domain S-box protein [Lacipirellulaceae bacterium]|nr:PAS domain S-box protein [Lacipirellulaceae bacterium]
MTFDSESSQNTELHQTAERLRLALAAGQLGDWSWDAATDLVTLGDRASEIFGLPAEQPIPWSQLRELLHEDDRERARLAVESALENQTDYCIEYRLRRSTGELAWVVAEGRGVYSADNNVVGMIGVVRDITERKRADELRYRLAAIVDSSEDAIVSKTLNGIIMTWNAGAERIFGYSAEEAIGRPILILIPKDRQHEEDTILSKIRRGERIEHYETVRLRKDGTEVNISLSVSPVKDDEGNIIGAAKIARDITERKRAEEALRRSEADLRTLADSIPQLVWMARPDGYIVWYNRGWYDYTGTTPEEMEGWGWQSLHDPAHLPKVMERWRHSLKTGKPFEMEFPLRGADGSFAWFLTRVNPVRDVSGKVLRWFGTNTNVDHVKRVEAALREETGALELINQTGIVLGSTLDLDMLVQSLTDAATKLCGAKFGSFFYNVADEAGDAYGRYAISGAPREAFEKLGHPRATPLFGPIFNGEKLIRSGDILQDPRYGQMEPHHGLPPGHLPVRSYLAVPVVSRTAEVIGGLFFGHSDPDVFDERAERLIVGVAAQAAVAIDNARLYDKVRRAAEERNHLLSAERAARSDAERINLMKDEFLATLSHELRTPLSAILGWSQVLSMGKVDEQELREGLEAIERNARAQTALIEDLLDMSRIISGKIRLDVQWTELAPIVEAAIESVRPSAQAKGILLRKILDPLAGPVAGDPTRLQQVVWNLLTNAIKFTPKGGKVDVMLERVDSHLEITVHDSGVGIKPEFLPMVFERFRQADASTTRTYGGLGLGLSIVKHLIELHGGAVRAKSPGEGQGATFIVSLPLAPFRSGEIREHPTTSKPGPIDCETVDLAGIKVLVVDDEPDARSLIHRVLTHCQAEVITAANVNEAMSLLKKHRPNVLISDIGMPEIDGYQFLRQVRQLPPDEGGRTPAIALTAFARSEDRTRAMMAGFQVHVAKPIEPQELLATVGSLIGRTGGGKVIRR